jgi:phosphoribosylaminoimidazolecarboxamide formyltransferase/IMP cyclohydrolase
VKPLIKIKRALLSVYDKTGITELASALTEQGVELISSGGTKKVLDEHGITCRQVSTITEYPEILDGRVKTLHPAIFGALLATSSADHQQQLDDLGIMPIDLVVVNLYPFEATIARSGITLEEVLEQIDVGGPSMIRAAAKNFLSKIVLTSPAQYPELIEEMNRHKSAVSEEFRRNCAVRAFQQVARYNSVIVEYLQTDDQFAEEYTLQGRKIQDLRYGENPHQRAAFYSSSNQNPLKDFEQLHGKELSYNNILDIDAALSMVSDFDDECFTVIIKHNNPCGAGRADVPKESYRLALAGDSVSAFGGIVGFNREIDLSVAEEMAKHFFECILAPVFSQAALDILTKKKNLRLLKYNPQTKKQQKLHTRTVYGGFLVQTADELSADLLSSKVISKRKPEKEEWKALEFAWRMTKNVHSNAIVLARHNQLIGIGAGQMSRVDSAELAIKKAQQSGHDISGVAAGSDAFFPFRDGIDVLAKAGVVSVVQPGGSIRDEEVIAAADEHNISMVVTGFRHFKH